MEAVINCIAKALKSPQAAIRIHDAKWARELAENVARALDDAGFIMASETGKQTDMAAEKRHG